MNEFVWSSLFAVVAVIAWVALLLVVAEGIGRGSDRLARTFGDETYAHTIRSLGAVRREVALELWKSEAAQHHRAPLSDGHRERFERRWRLELERFSQDQQSTLTEIDEFVSSIVAALGYPTDAFEHRTASCR